MTDLLYWDRRAAPVLSSSLIKLKAYDE